MSGSSAKAYRTGKLRQNICKYWSAFDEYSVDLITELETGVGVDVCVFTKARGRVVDRPHAVFITQSTHL